MDKLNHTLDPSVQSNKTLDTYFHSERMTPEENKHSIYKKTEPEPFGYGSNLKHSKSKLKTRLPDVMSNNNVQSVINIMNNVNIRMNEKYMLSAIPSGLYHDSSMERLTAQFSSQRFPVSSKIQMIKSSILTPTKQLKEP